MPFLHPSSLRHARPPTWSVIRLLGILALAGTLLVGCAAQSSGETKGPTPGATPGIRLLVDGNFATANDPADLHFVVVALNPRSGHVLWRSPLETPGETVSWTSEPVLEGGLVLVTAYATTTSSGVQHDLLEALDPQTGQVRWQHQAGNQLSGMPVVSGGVVYLSSLVIDTSGQQAPAGLAEALDSRTGAVIWHHNLAQEPLMPAIAAGRVFMITNGQQLQGGFTGAHLIALNSSDGAVLWDDSSPSIVTRGSDTENGGSTGPIVAGSQVYVQSVVRNPDGTANLAQLAFNAKDGHSIWQYPTEGIAASPALNESGDTLCTSAFAYPNSTVRGLSVTSGQPRWSITLDQQIASGCVAQGDTFYVNISDPKYTSGSILALNSRDGRQLWRTTINAPTDADGLLPPTVDGTLVATYTFPAREVGPVQGGVAVVDASTGKLIWKQDFPIHPDLLMDISGDQFYLREQNQQKQMLVACALATGKVLWTYELGHA
jgi:outer membrane protein assembly factor BamB